MSDSQLIEIELAKDNAELFAAHLSVAEDQLFSILMGIIFAANEYNINEDIKNDFMRDLLQRMIARYT